MSTSATAGALHLRHISHSYGSHEVLHDVTLTCPAGTSTAIVGPSGSGKTSLLRIVAGFLRPDAGTVQLDQTDITARPAHRRSIDAKTPPRRVWDLYSNRVVPISVPIAPSVISGWLRMIQAMPSGLSCRFDTGV